MRLASILALLFCGCIAPTRFYAQTEAEPHDPEQLAVVTPATAWVGPVYEDVLAPAKHLLETTTTDVVLFIDSPGGSVDVGFDFTDAMKAAQRRGVFITCYVPDNSMAASMASYILEKCDARFMSRTALILFHSVSVGRAPGGTVDDVERFAREMREVNDRLAAGIVGRLNVSMAYFAEKVRGDWWLGYEEALAVGAVDGVL